jgi:hypothetical protein
MRRFLNTLLNFNKQQPILVRRQVIKSWLQQLVQHKLRRQMHLL